MHRPKRCLLLSKQFGFKGSRLHAAELKSGNAGRLFYFPLLTTMPHTLHRPTTVQRPKTCPTPDKGKINHGHLNAKNRGDRSQSPPLRTVFLICIIVLRRQDYRLIRPTIIEIAHATLCGIPIVIQDPEKKEGREDRSRPNGGCDGVFDRRM